MSRNGNLCALFVGMQNGVAIVENQTGKLSHWGFKGKIYVVFLPVISKPNIGYGYSRCQKLFFLNVSEWEGELSLS